jgi:hypothetical protein
MQICMTFIYSEALTTTNERVFKPWFLRKQVAVNVNERSVSHSHLLQTGLTNSYSPFECIWKPILQQVYSFLHQLCWGHVAKGSFEFLPSDELIKSYSLFKSSFGGKGQSKLRSC